MQISLKLLLYTHKEYSDGSNPVMLQYIISGKVKRKVITRCHANDWDDKNKRVKSRVENSARINAFIAEEYSKAEKDLYEIKSGNVRSSQVFRKKDLITLADAFKLELARLEKDFKYGYYDKILAIQKQLSDVAVDIADIDERWFENMISEMEERGNTANTIKKKIKLIRGMILRYSHKGVSKEIKEVSIKTTKTVKQKLTSEELAAIENLPMEEGHLMTATRDLFVMQVYLRGIRVGDLLQAYAADFKDGSFSYVDEKTGKLATIRLIPRAQAIVDIYAGKTQRLFPFFEWAPDKKLSKFENNRLRLKHKETCTTIINRFLKVIAGMAGIKKPVSSHIARHTFARMAIDKINNPMVTMELLGHSSLAVHQQYLNDIRKDDQLNQAADDIFG
ncbi:tyrosine-type recombinase/integrase [Pedobacter antarcticus]|uniref:tyrosine-type recombinase/integrase n=1 Tax=Pedobacter antarcticus TaxID=34086 RepID=UPI00292F4EA4|nr:tyrosine-type recombinase/integrase [Pedobacter antarcticus]